MNLKDLGKIGVLMGGRSGEREISLRSGRAVAQALASQGLQVEALDTKDIEPLGKMRSLGLGFAFIALHGRGGEDGEIQRALEVLGIPYLGSDAESSARAFNKIRAKEIFEKTDIPTPRYEVLRKADWSEKLSSLRLPVFFKPPEEGSSLDVHRVADREEAREVAAELFRRHERILAEEAILGREITVGILGTQPLPVVEIVPHRPFYDYEAKYFSKDTEYNVPARLDAYIVDSVQSVALRTHEVLGLRDFSRIDMILADETPFVLEANTIPGFTESSLLPKAADAWGLPFSKLCVELIGIACRRLAHEEESKKERALAS
jgi:D-alanine-D-alanine ligase